VAVEQEGDTVLFMGGQATAEAYRTVRQFHRSHLAFK
jgi:hypothetical protein